MISAEQRAALIALVRRDRFSVFVELNALLYIGVLSLAGGLAWTFRDYVDDLGDAAILAILGALMAASFTYVFWRARPYSNHEVESPSLIYDYVLYFGCLVFSATLAFIETRFAIFGGWDTHLLMASLVFAGLAYRFDNRFVLSLAMSTLAAFLGLRLELFDAVDTEPLRLSAIAYGVLLLGVGGLLHRVQIKPHFLDVYLQLGANAALIAMASGTLEGAYRLPYLALLVVACAAAIYLGVRYRRFAFVAYGIIYAYVGISVRLLDGIGSITGAFAYFLVTGIIVVVALAVIARRFGRDE